MKHFTVTFQPDGRADFHSPRRERCWRPRGWRVSFSIPYAARRAPAANAPSSFSRRAKPSSPASIALPKILRFLSRPIPGSPSTKSSPKGPPAKMPSEPDIYKKYLSAAGNRPILGLAVDIGTTTVVVKLIDMKTGRLLATSAHP